MFKLFSVILILISLLFCLHYPTYASELTPEQSLSKIDLTRFDEPHFPKEYTSILDTLSDRCGTTPEHIADMSAINTKELFDHGYPVDNLIFLNGMLEATEDGTFGLSCEEIFAFLEVEIEQNL